LWGRAGSYFQKKTPAMKIHSRQNLKNQKGFTLIELLIVIAIIGILAAVAFPQFASYRSRSFGAAVISDLQSAHKACTIFWGTGANTNVTPCTVLAIQGPLYGFNITNNVALAINNGTEAAFNATATHASLQIPLVTWTHGPNSAITNDGGF
jgi:prepilin-type N-terminal cleavage/methylation domain-containing protein